MNGRAARLAAACSSLLLLSACGAATSTEPDIAGSRHDRTLRRVLLPDMTGMSSRVQDEIRRAHAAIDAATAATTAGELAAAYARLGGVFFAIGYFGSAELCYDNARVLAPLESRWSYYIGHAYRSLGDPNRSAEAFGRALQMDPDYVPARVWLGEVTLLGGQPELARLAFAAALSVQPRLQAALAGMGRVALEQREYTTALDYLERALTVDPAAAAIRYPLALAHRGLGDVEAAEAHLAARAPAEPPMADPWMDEIVQLRRRLAGYDSISPVRMR
jgi:tetratricopeptide (TPR) repeat protein